MNSRASRMTLEATWVVTKIVATHFLKPLVGIASRTRGCVGWGELDCKACLSVDEFSNQKRQVTWTELAVSSEKYFAALPNLPLLPIEPGSLVEF
jgi:hypothetical protein